MFWTHECTIIFRCIDIRYAAQTCCMKSKLLQSGWLCQLFSGFLVRTSWYAVKTLKLYNCFVTYLRSNDWLDIDAAAVIYCQHWSILENHFSGTPALLLAVICHYHHVHFKVFIFTTPSSCLSVSSIALNLFPRDGNIMETSWNIPSTANFGAGIQERITECGEEVAENVLRIAPWRFIRGFLLHTISLYICIYTYIYIYWFG